MNPAKELGKRRRDDEVPTESSQLLHISPPPGALTELECLIDGDSIEDGRVHLSKDFAIICHNENQYEEASRPCKLAFNRSSNQGGNLKLGHSFIEHLNLQPGDVFKMKYLSWKRGGGGKDGSDPLYYFSVEAVKPNATTDSENEPRKRVTKQLAEEQRQKQQRLIKLEEAAAVPNHSGKESYKDPAPLLSTDVAIKVETATAHPPAAAAAAAVAPVQLPHPKEAPKDHSDHSLKDLRLQKFKPLPKLPRSYAPDEPEDFIGFEEKKKQQEEEIPQIPSLHRQEIRIRNFPEEEKPLSPLEVCANDINALNSLIRQTKAAARADSKSTQSEADNTLRYRLSKLTIDSCIATEVENHFTRSLVVEGVYYGQKSPVFSQFHYTENSSWCSDLLGFVPKLVIESLKRQGASISTSLYNVLRGKWPFDVWMGDLNDRSLLPGGVGVIALSNIPAGNFVCHFAGEYISLEDVWSAQSEVETVSNALWLGNLSPSCNEEAIERVFSKFGGVKSVYLLTRKSKSNKFCAFVNLYNARDAAAAKNELQGAVVSSLTDEDELIIEYQLDNPAEKKGRDGGSGRRGEFGSGFGGEDSSFRDKSMYYSNGRTPILKNYRCVFDAQCVVPLEAVKTAGQRRVIERTVKPSKRYPPISNNQWRRLSVAMIDAKDSGNATRFMRRSEVHFNLAKVQLNVPNGPSKILYYAKWDISKGEELVREP